jgi:hypothetical protein
MKSNPACQVAFGVAPEFLEAPDKRALAADGFTAATGDSVENHWLFAGRFAGRRDPGDNGLVALAVPKTVMNRSQFLAHVKHLLDCDIALDGTPV